MTIGQLNKYVIDTLAPSLGEREAAATARLLLEDDLGVTPAKLLMNPDRTIEPETEQRFRRMTARIAQGEPPQYVVGKARFMGMDFKVSRATLIPRPETAELVDFAVDFADGRHGLRILDVGTGSGCIAIALARALPFADITAIDISREAAGIAAENAAALKAKVDVFCDDILHPSNALPRSLDIIISNPPYIAESERVQMEPRVKDHEPASALFVPDDDPLLFYRAIADFAAACPEPPTLFFEINPLFADSLASLLQSRGYSAEIRRDSQNRPRLLKALYR